MNVLSLFDGMSCGMLALERAGIKVDNYYASELDKYAIAVSQHNYPNIIRLGDNKFLGFYEKYYQECGTYLNRRVGTYF